MDICGCELGITLCRSEIVQGSQNPFDGLEGVAFESVVHVDVGLAVRDQYPFRDQLRGGLARVLFTSLTML